MERSHSSISHLSLVAFIGYPVNATRGGVGSNSRCLLQRCRSLSKHDSSRKEGRRPAYMTLSVHALHSSPPCNQRKLFRERTIFLC